MTQKGEAETIAKFTYFCRDIVKMLFSSVQRGEVQYKVGYILTIVSHKKINQGGINIKMVLKFSRTLGMYSSEPYLCSYG